MTDSMAQSWDQVEISCSFIHPAEGEPAEVIVPTAETQAAVREMLKDHFPEGPASAVESHKAYCEWRQANAMIFFKADKDSPQIAEIGRRWRAFVNAWQNFNAKDDGLYPCAPRAGKRISSSAGSTEIVVARSPDKCAQQQ